MTTEKEDEDVYMDLDLDLEKKGKKFIEEVKAASDKGVIAGIAKGVKKGASAATAPKAEQIAKKVTEQLFGNSTGGNIDSALNTITKTMELEALQTSLDNMRNRRKQSTIPEVKEESGLVRMVKELTAMGLNPQDILGNLDRNTLLAMINPKIAPFLSMFGGGNNNKQSNSGGGDIMPMLMMMLQQTQNKPAPQQPQQSGTQNNVLLQILMAQQQNQQQATERLLKMERENSTSKQNLLLEQMKPLLQRTSFAEEMSGVQEKMNVFKQMGMFGQSGQRSKYEADLDFATKKMGMEMKLAELQQNREMAMKDREWSESRQKDEMWQQFLTGAMNVLKNMKIQQPAPAVNRQGEIPQQPIPAPIQQNQPQETVGTSIAKKVSNRINELIGKNIKVSYSNQDS